MVYYGICPAINEYTNILTTMDTLQRKFLPQCNSAARSLVVRAMRIDSRACCSAVMASFSCRSLSQICRMPFKLPNIAQPKNQVICSNTGHVVMPTYMTNNKSQIVYITAIGLNIIFTMSILSNISNVGYTERAMEVFQRLVNLHCDC